jgi:Tol biopolymer transport system component
MCPSSFIANLETGETQQYIPESERYTWSGVLSPDGNTIAFLSIPSNGGGNVELYTVPLGGGEPTNVPVIANEDIFVDITALPNSDLVITPGLGDVYCFLLDWR